MSNAIANRYTQLFNNDRQAVLALLACSAALQLDDETACEAVELVAPQNGSSRALMRRVKRLGFIWKEWHGLWHVTEEVRRDLFDWLYTEIPETTIIKLRDRLAQKADARAAIIETDDQFAAHQKLLAQFEAAYQRLLIPEHSERGANELAELWRESPRSAGDAMARSVEYLADELRHRLHRLPDAILFLCGIAARNRDDNHAQAKRFGRLWRRARRGQPGHIHALSAHWLGRLIEQRDPATAEKAFLDSINWMASDPEKGLVYESLGDLLAINPHRLDEAERTYQQALTLVDDIVKAGVHTKLAAVLKRKQVRSKPEDWTNDERVKGDDFTLPLKDQMYQFVVESVRLAKTDKKKIDARFVRELVQKSLYERFFVQHVTTWQSRAEFFTFAAQVMREVLVNRARTQFATKFDAKTHSVWLDDDYEFGTQRDADSLAIDEALNSLQNIDPDQCRIAELVYYAAFKIEEAAEVLHMPPAVLKREWRTAWAFIQRELTKGKVVLQLLAAASLMTPTAFSREFNKSAL
jgi:RNA polymerase sigma factor (TIGR02999 family)